ncbi:MAG: methylmalonyl-CoA epimerase [Rhodospirillales bacterium]|nr:methylmalonyl-CoA epimerase [Rhodospirillales bacterium]
MGENDQGATPPPIPSQTLDHISIAVPDLEAAAEFYRATFGAEVDDAIEIPEQGMRMAYVRLANAKIELMQPTDDASPVGKFIQRNPAGGIHHLCFATPDADQAATDAGAAGLRIVGGGAPKPGHHGRKLFFLHPKDAIGTLIEVEEEETPPRRI